MTASRSDAPGVRPCQAVREALQAAVWAMDPIAALLERGTAGRLDTPLALEAARAALALPECDGFCGLGREDRERIGHTLRDAATEGACILTGEPGEDEGDCSMHAHEGDHLAELAARLDPWHDSNGNPLPPWPP